MLIFEQYVSKASLILNNNNNDLSFGISFFNNDKNLHTSHPLSELIPD